MKLKLVVIPSISKLLNHQIIQIYIKHDKKCQSLHLMLAYCVATNIPSALDFQSNILIYLKDTTF